MDEAWIEADNRQDHSGLDPIDFKHPCSECGTETWREDSELCSACLFQDLPV